MSTHTKYWENREVKGDKDREDRYVCAGAHNLLRVYSAVRAISSPLYTTECVIPTVLDQTWIKLGSLLPRPKLKIRSHIFSTLPVSIIDDNSTPRNVANGDYNIATNDAILSLANLSLTSLTKTNGKTAPAAIHSLLPPEIMAEIFTTRRPPRVTSPLVLGKVCGAWRELCWSIPSLWEVVDLLIVPARLDVQNELLEEWISRARSRNLHIHLNEEEPHRGWKEAPPHKIMHTIASFSCKWETADIYLPEDNYADLIPIKDNRLPVLKSLSI
ncbi:uncharacterized protein LACBIDRAFT_332602 [Laccaria bicolor S238N-H82]|uniref:Predicted protein n=1 Tax=Laccaria bicolor (strain S238N-H82 / ATCC MYA-4686) TaxID=486041 RepID=B0DTB5_LACBS|nr:uncharacterized protein LACBIDRAFT_332602 [Laccaria bicolor S238N-H82]EDR02247.1 predicted protein [Laccaria bicolor S238N-H82]|eukprot:XP_001887192.1 predicted protein [Laccaria bicolor S238N-H82]